MDNNQNFNNPFDEGGQNDSTSALDQTGTTPLDEGDSSGRPLAWIFLGFAAIVCGLVFAGAFILFKPDQQSLMARYFPSPTATLTRTPTQTSTQTATPTPSRTATPTPTPEMLTLPTENTPALEENFESEAHAWESIYSDGSVRVHLGRLVIRSNSPGYIAQVLCTDCPSFHESFYFQAEVSTAQQNTEEYGLVFCSPGGQSSVFYAFEIDPSSQTFHLTKLSGGNWTYPINRKFSNLIRKYPESNTLTVYYNQGEIKLYINDGLVGLYREENPSTCRQIGFIVNNAGFDMIADNVLAYKLPISDPGTPSP